MEDIALTRRLKRVGRLAPLALRVTTSARRWERNGVARTIVLMWTLRLLYFCGVGPDRLHRWYYGKSAGDAAGGTGGSGRGGASPRAGAPRATGASGSIPSTRLPRSRAGTESSRTTRAATPSQRLAPGPKKLTARLLHDQRRPAPHRTRRALGVPWFAVLPPSGALGSCASTLGRSRGTCKRARRTAHGRLRYRAHEAPVDAVLEPPREAGVADEPVPAEQGLSVGGVEERQEGPLRHVRRGPAMSQRRAKVPRQYRALTHGVHARLGRARMVRERDAVSRPPDRDAAHAPGGSRRPGGSRGRPAGVPRPRRARGPAAPTSQTTSSAAIRLPPAS